MKNSKTSARIFRIVTLVVAVLVILVFVIIPGLITYFIDLDRYRPVITSKLTEEIGKEVEIGRLSLSLIGGIKLTVKDVVVKDPKTAGKNILSTPRVTVNVSILRLFKRELGLKKIILKTPEFNIVKYRDGSLNIADFNAFNRGRAESEGERDFSASTNDHKITPAAFTPGDGEESPFKIKRIFIKSIEIEKGRFIYSAEKPRAGTYQPLELIEFSGIDLKIGSIIFPKEIGGIHNPFMTEEFSAKIEGDIEHAVLYETKISNIDLTCSVEGGKAVIKDLIFSIYNGVVKVKGVFRYVSEDPSGEMLIEASKIRFHELLNSVSDEENLIVGTLNLDGTFTFPLKGGVNFTSGLKGKGNVSVTDGTVPDFSIRDEVAKSLGIPPAILPSELNTGDFSYMGGGYYIELGKLFTDDFKTTGSSYNSTARGYLGFDKTLNFSGDIYPSENIVKSSLFEKITSLIGMGGKLDKIPFTLTGTLNNVNFKIEYDGLSEETLKNINGLFKSGNGDSSKNLEDLGKSILKDILK